MTPAAAAPTSTVRPVRGPFAEDFDDVGELRCGTDDNDNDDDVDVDDVIVLTLNADGLSLAACPGEAD